MNPNNERLNELLFRYVEECELNRNELSNEERETVEAWIETNESARVEMTAIQRHLRRLKDIETPTPSPDLASRCVEAIREPHRSQGFPIRYWMGASACAVLFVFLLGVWFGQNHTTPTQAPFVRLIKAQDYLIGRLETGLAKCYEEETLTPNNPWYQPLQNLRSANQQFAAAYEENEGDPVIERGLSLAVSQNINLLKSLCEYVENKKSIPDEDVRLLDTDGLMVEDSI